VQQTSNSSPPQASGILRRGLPALAATTHADARRIYNITSRSKTGAGFQGRPRHDGIASEVLL